MPDPIIGSAYNFTIHLEALAAEGLFLEDPPLVAGDVKVSKDHGVYANLATLPVAAPAGSSAVQVDLSAGEMAVTTSVNVLFHDPDGVWADVAANIRPNVSSIDELVLTVGVAGEGLTALATDTSGTTTLLARVPGTVQPQSGDTYALANGASGFVALKSVVDAISTTIGAAGAGLTATASAVWAVATRLLTAGTNIVLAKGTGVTELNDLSAGDVRTAVGLASANLDTQLGDLPTNGELATALSTADDAVLVAIAALNNLSSAQTQTAVAAALAAYPSATTAQVAAVTSTVSAAITALNNLSTAQVSTEIVDALSADGYAEPGQGAPGATISLAEKISYLYKSWRNAKSGDGTTEKLYGDDGITVHHKATTSETAGVVTKTEVGSGP